MILETVINGEVAHKALMVLGKVAARNLKDSPMKQVLMEIHPSYIRLFASNNSMTVSSSMPCRLVSQGSPEVLSIFVDAETLSSFLQTHKSPSISMKVDEDFSLSFKYPRGEFKTYWTEWRGFQGIPEAPSVQQVEFLAKDFVPVVRKAFRFLENDDIHGADRIILYLGEGALYTIATDNFALFISRSAVSNREAEYEVTITVDVANILYGAFGKDEDSDEIIRISKDEKWIYIQFGDTMITELQPENKLPLYKKIFEENDPSQIFSVNASEFTRAVESANAISKSRADKLEVDYLQDKLQIQLVNMEHRVGIREMASAKNVMGDDKFSVIIDPRRTLNSVKCFGGKLLKVCNYMKYNFVSFSDPDNESVITYIAKFSNNF